MARRRKGRPIHGWVALDKPAGLTSTQALARARRALNAAKAGHAGTLDPLATGVLPLAFGEATKTIPFAMEAAKRYRFTIRWGETRDSEDLAGTLLGQDDRRPDRAGIEAALDAFRGEIEQVPPKFSAIKVDGARAYDLAREGEDFELAARTTRIDRFDLVDQPSTDEAVFEVESGKGAYMRGLSRDLAAALGVRGVITALRRLAVGRFTESDAISLEDLAEIGHRSAVEEDLLPVHAVLDDIPALALTEDEASRLRNGRPVSLLRKCDLPRLEALKASGGANGVFRAMEGETLAALIRLEAGEAHPVRVMAY